MVEEEIKKEVKEFAILEKEYAKILLELSKKIKHKALSSIFESLSKDSEKHATLYETISELLSNEQPFISEEDFRLIERTINEHITTEAKMIEESRKILNNIKDPRVRLLAAIIYEDEEKHHKLLLTVKEDIAKKETFSETDFWNMVWRDSPYHGAPGG
ncbi:ferritin-like domain-containing protein [Fervidicoccus fontis]|uniref:Ferritin-like domain-containing protein n=2 Tax=Fervidicoccus fontis TaxID=683846 RepID=I0A2D3_FERFK|nr:rubrerythrin [Fervidicoccus fontis]AFH43140.1 hypothetical protein FFONT_1152 [Fervidicoccus fontis Kam940]MBE9390519.1 ferritin-like domain-containing protein [Fervidicoccus fontis]PMB75852.1 MAG: bifunctional molybdenum cofactor guanylyltransferase MobA/molybdopterin-guanine dinucleotide biosynthesis adaptor protein MobB [Fervidicoccus fontis]PMB77731.1 MAG: bifunctional molybdenum cofactor guanylyltransferase MobA/molybdopterin-guanine dinucleotide biosynthesis adaptor protein MobB [Fervi